MLTRAQKAQEISSVSEKFGKAKAAFIIDYKGMSVEQFTSLRKQLAGVKSEIRVVRNRLANIALKEYPDGHSALKDHLSGTNAMIFSFGDPSATAKMISEFSKEFENFDLKFGYMDGQGLDEKRIEYLSKLPSIEVLRAQFLGLLSAPTSRFVRVLAAVPSGFLRILKAKHDKSQ